MKLKNKSPDDKSLRKLIIQIVNDLVNHKNISLIDIYTAVCEKYNIKPETYPF